MDTEITPRTQKKEIVLNRVTRVIESFARLPDGSFDTRVGGGITRLFLDKSNSSGTRRNYHSIINQFVLFINKRAEDVNDNTSRRMSNKRLMIT
jgi:hypothetical protein